MSDIVASEFKISDEQIALLNAARTLLSDIGKQAQEAGYDVDRKLDSISFGRLAESAASAEWSVFQVLNAISAHRLAPLTEDQLHNQQIAAVS